MRYPLARRTVAWAAQYAGLACAGRLSRRIIGFRRLIRASSFIPANLRSEKPIRLAAKPELLVADNVAMEPARPPAGCEVA